MLCDECGKRPATVHVQKIVNGQKSESHLCQECAASKGEINLLFQPFSVNSFLSAMLGAEAASPREIAGERGARCSECGLGYEDFARVGKLGCGNCYEAFQKPLDGLLRRIHGSDRHAGKIPKKGDGGAAARRELKDLRDDLNRAIQSEAYEKAAMLRDRIREIENTIR